MLITLEFFKERMFIDIQLSLGYITLKEKGK